MPGFKVLTECHPRESGDPGKRDNGRGGTTRIERKELNKEGMP